MNDKQSAPLDPFVGTLKQGLWLFGVSCWLFGITDRGIALFADGSVSALDLTQIGVALFFFISWLFLKPAKAKPTSRV